MTKDEQEMVMAAVDGEGFDYAFCDYSDFDEIKNEEFHKARVEYVEAAKKLKKIIDFYNY